MSPSWRSRAFAASGASGVGIGVTGGELYRVIHDRIGDPFFGVGLNPGHLIHLDEWVNSPIYDGSTEALVGLQLECGRVA